MMSERWQQVASIYEAAAELTGADRETYLVSACGDDVLLRKEIDSLLAQERASSPLDKPVWVPDNLLVQPMPLPVGTFIGVYRVEGILGAGGMGQVYRAKDTKLARSVALKVLPDAFAGDPERRARFQREAQVLAALNHPHIGAIHGFEDSDGSTRWSSNWSTAPRWRSESHKARCHSTKRRRSPDRLSTPSKPRTIKASSIAI